MSKDSLQGPAAVADLGPAKFEDARVSEMSANANPTFVKDQLALQRNPSIARSIQSSNKSVKSIDSTDRDSYLSSVIEAGDSDTLGSSSVSPLAGEYQCDLSKSRSVRSTVSTRSTESTVSAVSVPSLGTYAFGSLKVHTLPEQPASPPDNPASQCLVSGDIILISGLPKRIFVGVDNTALTVSEERQFDGVRYLPPGAHFIYAGTDSVLSIRSGFWVISYPRSDEWKGKVFAKRWDPASETLDEEVSAAEVMFQKEAVPKIFDSLYPYGAAANDSSNGEIGRVTVSDPKMWERLTFSIRGEMLNRVTGHQWNQWRVTSNHDTKPTLFKNGESIGETVEGGIQDIASEDRVFTFLLPHGCKTYTELAVGRARTEQALDSTSYILRALEDRSVESLEDLTGEMQFCFVTGMFLGNLVCMKQWSHHVTVLFKSYRFALQQPVIFRQIIETLHSQLIYDEEGLDGSIFDHDNDCKDELKYTLTIFKSRLNELLLSQGAALTPEQKEVGEAFEKLESWLWKWGWDLRASYVRAGKLQLEDGEIIDVELTEFEAEDERGEYAPVIVDLDDSGRERGLVTF